MRKYIAIAAILLMLGGCAAKNPTKGTYNKKTGTVEYAPQSDYQAYALAVSHAVRQPKEYATREISGVKWIKLKGSNITIVTRDEFKGSPLAGLSLDRPKNWYETTMDTVAEITPYAVKALIWKWGFDFGSDTVDALAKDPVVVDQRLDTVTNTSSSIETVKVVNQQELIQPVIVETPVNNGSINNGTIINNPTPIEEILEVE